MGQTLRLAASLEKGSEHPLANAVLSAAAEKGVAEFDVSEFDSVPGQGIIGVVTGHGVALGNQTLMESLNIEIRPLADQADNLRRTGATVTFVAVDGKAAGLLAISDPVKASTPEALASLHDLGIGVAMVTGDSRTTAEAVARTLGISEVEAGVLPERKSDVVAQLQGQGHVVAMAGDGVNDARALARADIGIAMGGGTDIAMESAAVTLLKGDLRGIVRARRLSRATMANIKQNLFFAFIYNGLGVPIAAGVLYPVFGILLSPIVASIAMSLSSVSVIINALRLRRLEL